MTVAKRPVIQLATAEHIVELKELRNERAAARTDVTTKCKLQASFYCSTNMLVIFFDPFEAFLFCNCLRIILMFFDSVKSCEVKKCKIDKHMELGLYRQPIINFQEPKSKGTSRGMYVKVLICSKCWKNSTSTTASSPMSSIFQVNLVLLSTFFCPGTTSSSLNFQRTYLIAVIVWFFCFDL